MGYLSTDIGVLRLYTGLRSGSVQVWNQTGSVGSYWAFAQVNITTTDGFELIFDAERGMYEQCLVCSLYIYDGCILLYLVDHPT